jgi:CSLREA domain-containing protein
MSRIGFISRRAHWRQTRQRLTRALVAAAGLALALGAALRPSAADTVAAIAVTTVEDELNADGDCSLREAIQAANTDTAVDACPAGSDEDLIIVPAGTYSLTLAGANEDDNATGDLDVWSDLTLAGAGAGQTILDGARQDRVLHIHGSAIVELNGLEVSQGRTSVGVHGGGIYNEGALTLVRCVVKGNTSGAGTYGIDGGDGGGIYNEGTLMLDRCTVGDNATGTGSEAGRFDPGTNAGNGGGIYNSGALTLTHSTVSGNATGDALSGPYGGGGSGGDGGGIYSSGWLWVYDSTVSGNVTGDGASDYYVGGSGGNGGGIYGSSWLRLDHGTVTGNATGQGGGGAYGSGRDGEGGGLFAIGQGVDFLVKNTILGGNTASGDGPDCAAYTPLTSYGYNLIQDTDFCDLVGDLTGNLTGLDPRLAPLAGYGGPTYTHALLTGSPAIDAGSCTDVVGQPVTTDQRGVARPSGGGCDMGAYERQATYLPLVIRGR